MKIYNGRRGGIIAAFLLIAVCVGLTLAACKGSGSWRVGIETPAGDASVGFEYDSNGGRITDSPGGARCDLQFTGPDGSTTGTMLDVPVGQTAPIPVGTTGVVVTGVHPQSGPNGNGNGGMAEISEEELACDIGQVSPRGRPEERGRPFQYFIVVIPIDAAIDLGPGWGALSNVYGDFRYRSTSILDHDELYALVAPYVLTDIGNQPAVVPGLDVQLLVRCVPNADGRGGRLRVTDQTRQIESFQFVMNGVELATLAHGSLHYDAPNGWKVVETEIKFSSFRIYPGGSSNTFRLSLDTNEAGEVVLPCFVEYS